MKEFHRICKNNGQLIVIDIGKPDNRILRVAMKVYMHILVPIFAKCLIRQKIEGNPWSLRARTSHRCGISSPSSPLQHSPDRLSRMQSNIRKSQAAPWACHSHSAELHESGICLRKPCTLLDRDLRSTELFQGKVFSPRARRILL